MIISELEHKRILIVGFGREGQDSFLFLRKKFPDKNIGIADKKEFQELPKEAQEMLNADHKVVLYFGPTYVKQIHAYDVIIKSPGIPARVIRSLTKKNQILTSQTNLFFANCKGTIIGVTGTKGKSTTSTLLYEVLKAAKKTVYLVGNIEQPALQFLHKTGKDDIFIYELSSAQLEILPQSPHVAILLNLYPEHLDFHGTFQAYRDAKANIAKFQKDDDYIIFNETSEIIEKIAQKSKAKKLAFKPKKHTDLPFIAAIEPIFLTAKIFDIPKQTVEKVLKKFTPLPHRLQHVGTHKGIVFYNDSLATIPEATNAALATLGQQVHTLIAGGFDRGISMENLAVAIINSKLRILILFPTTGEYIAKEIEKIAKKKSLKKLPQIFFVNSLATAVQLAYDHTPKGKICLLSPAASSFNLFRDYKERGEIFQKFVKLYAKKKNS